MFFCSNLEPLVLIHKGQRAKGKGGRLGHGRESQSQSRLVRTRSGCPLRCPPLLATDRSPEGPALAQWECRVIGLLCTARGNNRTDSGRNAAGAVTIGRHLQSLYLEDREVTSGVSPAALSTHGSSHVQGHPREVRVLRNSVVFLQLFHQRQRGQTTIQGGLGSIQPTPSPCDRQTLVL